MLAGLDTLAAEPPILNEHGSDPRWPDLTNAVHWVVDDTWWDDEDPSDSIGSILVDEEEAEAMRAVVREIVGVSERQAVAGSSDRAWLGDDRWPHVRAAARDAAALIRRNDG